PAFPPRAAPARLRPDTPTGCWAESRRERAPRCRAPRLRPTLRSPEASEAAEVVAAPWRERRPAPRGPPEHPRSQAAGPERPRWPRRRRAARPRRHGAPGPGEPSAPRAPRPPPSSTARTSEAARRSPAPGRHHCAAPHAQLATPWRRRSRRPCRLAARARARGGRVPRRTPQQRAPAVPRRAPPGGSVCDRVPRVAYPLSQIVQRAVVLDDAVGELHARRVRELGIDAAANLVRGHGA